jgi:CBS domain-containing protein
MGKVSNILSNKSKVTYSVTPDTIVFDALDLMFQKNVSALLVLDGEKLVGIFTERDYARKVILQGRASKETLISEIMTGDLITVTPDASIGDCMKLMSSRFIRHLPVLENDKVVGVISIGDVVKYIIDEQQFIIENMEHYITS